jgi:hypothetical protein
MSTTQEDATGAAAGVPVLKEYEQEGFAAWTKAITKAKLQGEEGTYTEESVHTLDDFDAWARLYADLGEVPPPEKATFLSDQAYLDGCRPMAYSRY